MFFLSGIFQHVPPVADWQHSSAFVSHEAVNGGYTLFLLTHFASLHSLLSSQRCGERELLRCSLVWREYEPRWVSLGGVSTGWHYVGKESIQLVLLFQTRTLFSIK